MLSVSTLPQYPGSPLVTISNFRLAHLAGFQNTDCEPAAYKVIHNLLRVVGGPGGLFATIPHTQSWLQSRYESSEFYSEP